MTRGECIHGLEVPLCAVCFPRAAPESVRSTRTDPRQSGVRLHAPRPRSAPRAAGAPAPTVDLGTLRVHHVTHLENLLPIVDDGALRADATPLVDVSSAAARDLRSSIQLPSGGTVADRVAFYLGSDAARWRDLRSGAEGPMWSDAARASRSGDFVILVASLEALGDGVLADGDAAATLTRFAPISGDRRAATAMLRRLNSDPVAMASAEALGPPEVPLDALSMIIVANDPVRERVRALLSVAEVRLRVAVNPPSFSVD